MFRTTTVGLVAFLGLLGAEARTATAQTVERMPQNRTLTAKFPSVHAYIIEVQFSKLDKPGTFKAWVFDPSTQGDYDRQKWEAYRLKTNDPDSQLVSRRIDFTTGQGNRPPEREQILEKIKQERNRIETFYIKPVDVKPHPSVAPKAKVKPETKGFSYKKDAPKQVGTLAETRWISNAKVIYQFSKQKRSENHPTAGQFVNDREMYRVGADGRLFGNRMAGIGVWRQKGNDVWMYDLTSSNRLDKVTHATISGDGGTIRVDAARYPDGSVSDPETWTRFKSP